jgi:hypothetical protein
VVEGVGLFAPREAGLKRVSEHWYLSNQCDPTAIAIYERHYSCRKYADGRKRRQFVGMGQKMVLISGEADALYVWRRFMMPDMAGQSGVGCSVFRNEGPELSSTLILEAMKLAWARWPGERLYTYVNPAKVRSDNPGCCFLKAGWRRCGATKGGLMVLEATGGESAG